MNFPISNIYYWVHHGHLGSQKDIIYPQKTKRDRAVQSKKFKLFGRSIGECLDYINNRSEVGHFEIDMVILICEKNQCLLTMTDRKSRYEIIRLIKDKTKKFVNESLFVLIKNMK